MNSIVLKVLQQGESPVDNLEDLVECLEANKIDLTKKGKETKRIGKLIANDLGEKGRQYFLRLCAIRPGSDASQKLSDIYSECMVAEKGPETLFTLYFLAKKAFKKKESSSNTESVPRFSNSVYTRLPEFIKDVVRNADTSQEKDALLLSSLTTISACLPNYYALYDRKKIYSNLFLFVVAEASAGKGILSYSRDIVLPVHEQIIEENKEAEKEYYKRKREMEKSDTVQYSISPELERPRKKKLFIPANNSSTGVYQNLSDSGSRGLMFETEGDTLTQALKTDYGNYSDGFRKAFHHEPITYSRRTNNEDVFMEKPQLSVVLSGTPVQLKSLIPNAENGLFSRFIYYKMELKTIWKNVFPDDLIDTEEHYKNLGKKLLNNYNVLREGDEIEFKLTKPQEEQFHKAFEEWQKKYKSLVGKEFISIVRRYGVITVRIAMILTMVRKLDEELADTLTCTDDDFRIALEMIRVLLEHSKDVFGCMPKTSRVRTVKNATEGFYDALPFEFDRATFLKVGNDLNMKDKTIEYHIRSFVTSGIITRTKHNHYIKTENNLSSVLEERFSEN